MKIVAAMHSCLSRINFLILSYISTQDSVSFSGNNIVFVFFCHHIPFRSIFVTPGFLTLFSFAGSVQEDFESSVETSNKIE